MIPLAALLPIILPLVPGIIQGVENIFGAKKGEQKKLAAVNMVAAAIKVMRAEGMIPAGVNAATVESIIETVLELMKRQGTLIEEGKQDAVVVSPIAPPPLDLGQLLPKLITAGGSVTVRLTIVPEPQPG